MAKRRKLEVLLTTKNDGTGFRDAGKDVDRFGTKITKGSQSWAKSLASFGKKAAIGLGVLGVAAAKFGLDAVHAFEESAQVGKQTATVIKSMGAQSWITADAVAGLAESLSAKAGIDDELIQSGENVLLTFARVRNEVGRGNDIFDQATKVALDMSVALGQDMQQSVIQVGKALNDPVRGVTALRRVGVQLTRQQEDSIRTFVEQGDILSAQKVILGELSSEFAGSAAAQATASGKMSVAWGNFQEAIGEKLAPILEAFSGWVIDTGIPALERLSDWIGTQVVPALESMGGWLGEHVVPAVQALAGWLTGTLIPALADMARWLSEHQRVLASVAIGLAAVGLAILVSLVPAFLAWAGAALAAAATTLAAVAPLVLIGAVVALLAYVIITHWDTIRDATVAAFRAVRDAIAAAFNWVRENWPLLLGILTGPIGLAVVAIARNWDSIKAGATAVKNWIRDRFNDVVGFVTGLPGRIGRAAAGMWDGIADAFRSMINRVIDWWNGLRIPGFSININGPGPIPDFHFSWDGLSLPNIPRLAEGGIATRPTLAMIGERGPEAVIPLGRGGGGGNVYNVTLDLRHSIGINDERKIVDMVTTGLRRAEELGMPITIRGRRL